MERVGERPVSSRVGNGDGPKSAAALAEGRLTDASAAADWGGLGNDDASRMPLGSLGTQVNTCRAFPDSNDDPHRLQ